MASTGTLSGSLTYQFGRGSTSVSKRVDITSQGESNIGVTIPTSTTNEEFNIDADVSKIKAIYINSTTDMTLYTNAASTGAPDETISLKANVPLVWNSEDYYTNLFGTDITSIFVTNSSGNASTFDFNIMFDL